MKRSFLMMCPLLFSCIAGGYATAETCDYIVTDENLQQVAFFDKKPISLCFTTSVDRFVTGSYKGWSVSLEKGGALKEPPEKETEPEQVTEAAPQQTTVPQPPEVEENIEEEQTAEEPAEESTAPGETTTVAEQHVPDEQAGSETGEPVEDHAGESVTPPQTTAEQITATDEPHGSGEVAGTEQTGPAEEHTEDSTAPPPVTGQPEGAAADHHTIAAETHSTTEQHAVEEKADAGDHKEGHAPQSLSTSQPQGPATPLQKGVVQPEHGEAPVVPQSSWVEVEQHQATGTEDAHPGEHAEHPAPDAAAGDALPAKDEAVVAEHAVPPASADKEKAGDLVPLQRGVVSLHKGETPVPQSRWVEVAQHDPATPEPSHAEDTVEHPAPVKESAVTVEEHKADDQQEQAEQAAGDHPVVTAEETVDAEQETAAHTQQQEQEQAEPAAGDQPAVTAEETVDAEQETTADAQQQELEKTEPAAGDQPAVTAEETVGAEQEETVAEEGEPVAEIQFPFEDRLMVAPLDKGARDTLLFAYVEGKAVPIIIQLKNNME